MKLHDLKPAAGSRRPKTRVGRGIAAGQGKTAGRGTKGQKARAGGSIPAWFEGGQTPIHVRVPKLRGFNNTRFGTQYAVVNVGQISAYAEAGRFGVDAEQSKSAGKTSGKSADQPVVTVNAEVLAQSGLIRGDDKPLKVLGQGDVSQKLFVAADAFSASARRKIEEAGGFVQLLGGDPETAAAASAEPASTAPTTEALAETFESAPSAESAPQAESESTPESAPESESEPTPAKPKRTRAPKPSENA